MNTQRNLAAAILLACGAAFSGSAQAATNCSFTIVGTTMLLDGDCWTDATIVVPDGFTLDGQDFTITAKDPFGSSFTGGVIENGGATAHVTHVVIVGELAAIVCHSSSPDLRLRGILFDGASGTITHNKVLNLNQGPSGCQEGNAIEVRNAPFDGTHPAITAVEVGHNVVDAYQKGGLINNGDVEVWVHHNMVGASATQQNLAANSVQLGFGAFGVIENNQIAGNQWLGLSDYSATAVLLYLPADGAVVAHNNIGGNADVGIYVYADAALVDNNRVFETGTDGLHGDYGIVNFGLGNVVSNNKIRGYTTPTYGQTDATKVIPSPHDPSGACGNGQTCQ